MHKDVFSDISSELESVQEQIQAVLASDELPVDEALRSALNCPGKLLRPGLLLLIAKNGREPDLGRGITLGCAVEMLHLATLLHDDVIDCSATRRRRPTAAKMLGDKGSILLGDYLFAKCLRVLVENGELEALGLLSRTVEMCAEGELLEQANLFNLGLSTEKYMSITNKKTAEMFAASCKLGSDLHGHVGANSDALSEFGRLFGQGFQIIDDVLDFLSDVDSIGKPPGQDLAHGVITLPTILALRGSGNASGSDARAVREPTPKGGAESPWSHQVRFRPEEEAQIRRLVLRSDALEATVEAARDCFLEAQRRASGLDRNDGLASSLHALCDATLSRGEEALFSFRSKTGNSGTNLKGERDEE